MNKSFKKILFFLTFIVLFVQMLFALFYYFDPCNKDPKIQCQTIISHWSLWQVWLPLGIFILSGIVISSTLCMYYLCIVRQYPPRYFHYERNNDGDYRI